jgi:phenylpyruvate tautomerase PptA (4-oxalocrotonate tautomerase family)
MLVLLPCWNAFGYQSGDRLRREVLRLAFPPLLVSSCGLRPHSPFTSLREKRQAQPLATQQRSPKPMPKLPPKPAKFLINSQHDIPDTEHTMPLTTIDIRTTYPAPVEVEIIEAVQKALLETLELPEHDRNVKLAVHAPHRMIVPPTLAQPEKRTVVNVAMFPGRSVEAKKRLYQAIVKNLENCAAAIARDHVLICLQEVPFEHWGIRGGQAASDVDLGFSTQIE